MDKSDAADGNIIPLSGHALIKAGTSNSLVQHGLLALEKSSSQLPQNGTSGKEPLSVKTTRTTTIDNEIFEVVCVECASQREAKESIAFQIADLESMGYESGTVSQTEHICRLCFGDYSEIIQFVIEGCEGEALKAGDATLMSPPSIIPGMERADAGCTGYYKTKGVYCSPEIAWQFFLGTKPQEPVVCDGKVYAATEGNTIALDLVSGQEIWEVPIGSRASPAVDEGIVVVHGYDRLKNLDVSTPDTVYGLYALTGSELWRVEDDSIPHCTASPSTFQGDFFQGELIIWDYRHNSFFAYWICKWA